MCIRDRYVPCVTDFKLLQILGEGYEGKVLQARKKDCGVMYALKVLSTWAEPPSSPLSHLPPPRQSLTTLASADCRWLHPVW